MTEPARTRLNSADDPPIGRQDICFVAARTHPHMLIPNTRRLRHDEGISLVEMLVAMVILMVVLTAMLGAMIASAQSITAQRSRSAATRVGNQHLERLRATGFDAIAVTTAGPAVTTASADGRSYTIATTVTETAAAPSTMTAPAGSPTVKNVTATVRWVTGGQARSLEFSTAVAHTRPTFVTGGGSAAQTIDSIVLTPNPTVVDAAGVPTRDIGATAVLSGFTATTLVTVSWSDDGGPASKTLTSADGGITWTGTITATAVRRKVLAGEASPGLTFTLRAGPGGPEQQYTLSVVEETAGQPVITAMSASPQPIGVKKNEGSCSLSQYCNTVPVTFAATVTNLDPLQDSVRLSYVVADGTSRELALVYDTVSGQWQSTFPAGSTQFKIGTQRFTFQVLRSAGGATSGFLDISVIAVA